MNVLLIGGNGLLGRGLIDSFLERNCLISVTARKIESISQFEDNSKVKIHGLDFSSRESIDSFFSKSRSFDDFDVIIQCSSPFEGSFEKSSYEEFDLWGNAFSIGLKLSKLAFDKLKPDGNTNSKK